jgi:hypothetical protein
LEAGLPPFNLAICPFNRQNARLNYIGVANGHLSRPFSIGT